MYQGFGSLRIRVFRMHLVGGLSPLCLEMFAPHFPRWADMCISSCASRNQPFKLN